MALYGLGGKTIKFLKIKDDFSTFQETTHHQKTNPTSNYTMFKKPSDYDLFGSSSGSGSDSIKVFAEDHWFQLGSTGVMIHGGIRAPSKKKRTAKEGGEIKKKNHEGSNPRPSTSQGLMATHAQPSSGAGVAENRKKRE